MEADHYFRTVLSEHSTEKYIMAMKKWKKTGVKLLPKPDVKQNFLQSPSVYKHHLENKCNESLFYKEHLHNK